MTSFPEPAVTIEGLSKSYPLFNGPVDRFRQLLGPSSCEGVLALSNINLSIERGQIFGIVGKNGSGKSTLLRLLTGILPPTKGSVRCSGRVAALLELGAGFNPEFSGRDNVLITCALLGIDESLAREKLPDIEEFADVGPFFDRPVKTYSTGMYARVAFAALAVCEPDILILDEILAVGDEAFQRKCLTRIETLAENGCTVILVTHNSQLVVEFCNAAALLASGELVIAGEPKTVIHEYYKSQGFALPEDKAATAFTGVAAGGDSQEEHDVTHATSDQSGAYFDEALVSTSAVAYGNADAVIDCVRLVDSSGRKVNVIARGGHYELCYRVSLQRDGKNLEFGSLIKTTKGVELGGLALGRDRALRTPAAGTVFEVSIPFAANLLPGTYFINAGVRGDVGGQRDYLHRLMDASVFRIIEESESNLRGMVDLSIIDRAPSFSIVPSAAAS